MEEVRNHQEEHVLPAKRKPDPELVAEAPSEGQDDESSKKAKLENSVTGGEDKKKNDVCSDEDEEDEEEYKVEEEEEQSNGKGKAIRSDDKGKGKLVEDSDSDSGSDSDSDSSVFGSGSDSGGESDLSDDPLAEVDLDNILPSRTRRRSVRPGVFISNSAGNPKHDGDTDA